MKLTVFVLMLIMLPASLSAQDDKFLKAAKEGQIIVVGEVVKADLSLTFWSGIIPSIKQVRYRVIKVLKGTVNSKDIMVGHFVVYGSYTAGKGDARLSPKLFKRGNELILILTKEEDGLNCRQKEAGADLETFCSPLENYGVRPATSKLIEKVEEAIKN